MAHDCDGIPDKTSDLNRHLDNADRLYIYNKEDDTYKLLGIAETPGLVGTDEDGLVYPELFNTIKKIQELHSNGNYNSFQLSDTKPYFYYFYNSDRLIKFKYINQTNELWIEVDRAGLYKKLFANAICAGSRGERGNKGPKGRDGLPAPNEKFIIPFPDGKFSTTVPTPIEEDVSIRLFDELNEQFFEVLISVDGEIREEEYKEHFDKLQFVDNKLSGKLKDSSNKIKARQKGAKGPDGKDGNNYIKVIEELDEFVVAKDAVISLRKSNINNNIKFRKLVVTETPNIVRLMSPVIREMSGVDKWVSSEFSSSPTKIIKLHELQDVELEKPELDLPVWVPSPGCVSPSATLFTLPSGGNFEIIEDPKITSNCKEDLWFCENSSGACTEGITIRGDPPPSDYPDVAAFPVESIQVSNNIEESNLKSVNIIDDVYSIESVRNFKSSSKISNNGSMVQNIAYENINISDNLILPKYTIEGNWVVERATSNSIISKCNGLGSIGFEYYSDGTNVIIINASNYNGLSINVNGHQADIELGNIIMDAGKNDILIFSKDNSDSLVNIDII
jgi:hypothetical protein